MTDASSHHPDHPLALARAALASAPSGLVTDLDGTLAPIVADPFAARPLPEAVAALSALAARLAVVAVVTGRRASEARQMLGTDRLPVFGNHGLEWLDAGALEASTLDRLAWAVPAVARVSARVPSMPGVWVEQKGLSTTFHYRNAADREASRDRLLEEIGEVEAEGLVVRPGRMSLELRPAGAGNKGTAIDELVARHALRGLVVLGDDVTDLDMFRAASAARAAGRLNAAIFAVGGAGEVPAAVGAAADAVLPDPTGAARLLADLASDAR
ncbi:MAG TPA: trehalose-phosphatase [Candidatus Limnocylindria bacterium]|nr:trehalose-phosphatase [Candidatus Limnocylindria bacterium]